MLREVASQIHFDQVDRLNFADVASTAIDGVGVSADEIIDLLGSVCPLGIWRLEIATGLMYWNRDAFLIHGLEYSVEPVSLSQALARYHREDAQLVEQLIEAATAGKNRFRYVMRIGDASEGYRLVALAGRYRDTNGGELVGYCHEFQELVRSVVLTEAR